MASPAVASGSALPAAEPRRQRAPSPRTDIQALQALAVSLVFAYHLFPETITGGYVGVDVFFVLSGFLISAHLLGQPAPQRRGSRNLLGPTRATPSPSRAAGSRGDADRVVAGHSSHDVGRHRPTGDRGIAV